MAKSLLLNSIAGAFLRHRPQKCWKRATNARWGAVYLLENPRFSQFFVADSVPGSIILTRWRN